MRQAVAEQVVARNALAEAQVREEVAREAVQAARTPQEAAAATVSLQQARTETARAEEQVAVAEERRAEAEQAAPPARRAPAGDAPAQSDQDQVQDQVSLPEFDAVATVLTVGAWTLLPAVLVGAGLLAARAYRNLTSG